MRKQLIVAVLLVASAVAWGDDIAPSLRWFINAERATDHDINLRRGETVVLEPTFRNYTVPINLTAAHLVVLRYKPTTATNWYYTATGSVYNATGGVAQVRWTSAQEAIYSSYSYEIAVQSTDSMLLRSYGTISLTPGVAVDGSTSAAPAAVTSIDWATVEHSNVGAAPFLSGFDTADLEAFDATLTNGTADLDINTLNVRGSFTASAAGLSNWPSLLVTNVIDGGTTGGSGTVERDGNTITITFPAGAEGEIEETNRLLWVVGGETIGYVDTNGITMVKGSLQLFEDDLNCNVRAYDGSESVPSISFYASPSIGWYRKSLWGSYAWAYTHNSNDVFYLAADGIYMAGTNIVQGYTVKATSGFEVGSDAGLTTNITVVTSVLTNSAGSVTGLVEQALNFHGGILVP